MTERLNIRRMQTPESEPKSGSFNIERDVNGEDWKAMDQEYKDLFKSGNLVTALELLYNMKTLDSTRPLPLGEGDLDALVRESHRDKAQTDGRFIRLASYLYSIDPATGKLDENLAEPLNGLFPVSLLPPEGVGGWQSCLSWGTAARLLKPDWKSDHISSHYQELEVLLQDLLVKQQWGSFISVASLARIACPDVVIPHIGDAGWSAMRSLLRKYRVRAQSINTRAVSGTFHFAEYAAGMRILAAGEVRIPASGGLELVMHKPKADSQEPVPPQPQPLEL